MSKFNEIHTNWFCRDRRKNISLEEKKKKYLAENPEEKCVAQYRIDNPDEPNVENKKCDFALYVHDDEEPLKCDDRLIFIELKGTDINRAFKQITKTIEDWVIAYNIRPRRMDARVVAARVPSPHYVSTEQARLQKRLNRYDQGDIKIGSNGYFKEIL